MDNRISLFFMFILCASRSNAQSEEETFGNSLKFIGCLVCAETEQHRTATRACVANIPDSLKVVAKDCINKQFGKDIEFGYFDAEFCANERLIKELLVCIIQGRVDSNIEFSAEEELHMGLFAVCSISLYTQYCSPS